MTRAKILKLALKKANKVNNIFPSIVFTDGGGRVRNEQFYKGIIFSHYFAKAFWGDEPICDYCGESKFDPGESFDGEIVTYDPHCKNCGCPAIDIVEFGKMDGTTLPAYLYHLQQMIIEKDFIKYLEKFL